MDEISELEHDTLKPVNISNREEREREREREGLLQRYNTIADSLRQHNYYCTKIRTKYKYFLRTLSIIHFVFLFYVFCLFRFVFP